MEDGLNQRLQEWFENIGSTENEELDCDALIHMLEKILRVAESGKDIRSVLPAVAVHLDHCPECGDMYESLVLLSRESP